MIARLVTALLGIPLVAFLIFYPDGLPFAIAIGIIAFLGALEFYNGARRIGARPVEWVGLIATVTIALYPRILAKNDNPQLMPALLTGFLILAFFMEIIRSNRAPLVNIGSTIFGAVYVGWLLGHLLALREIPFTMKLLSYDVETGSALVMFTFICTWACDTSAFFIGSYYGKKKFAPKLSPNKTVEGAVAGLVGCVLVAVMIGMIIKIQSYHAFALGIILGIACQLGDLSASAIKREASTKDFGKLVPGHGVILDRFDSILFASPAMLYYYLFFIK